MVVVVGRRQTLSVRSRTFKRLRHLCRAEMAMCRRFAGIWGRDRVGSRWQRGCNVKVGGMSPRGADSKDRAERPRGHWANEEKVDCWLWRPRAAFATERARVSEVEQPRGRWSRSDQQRRPWRPSHCQGSCAPSRISTHRARPTTGGRGHPVSYERRGLGRARMPGDPAAL
jgi:hypothetical protein